MLLSQWEWQAFVCKTKISTLAFKGNKMQFECGSHQSVNMLHAHFCMPRLTLRHVWAQSKEHMQKTNT
eukprot:121787-Amphidinium_carterae.1